MTADLLALLNNPDCPNELIRDRLLDEGIDMAAIHVVVGECGAHSDHTYWYVAAFLDPDAAQALARKLNLWCHEHDCLDPMMSQRMGLWPAGRNINACLPRPAGKPPDDPGFAYDDGGTSYGVAEIPLKG